MDRKQLKDRALKQLKGRWGEPIAVCLLFYLIIAATVPAPILTWLLIGPLTIGMCNFMSNFVRLGERKIERLFSGFSDFAGNMVLGLLVELYIFLWGLLFIIPGIIKKYSYAASYYIKLANPDMSASECIEKSMEVMDGHKWELFVLELSFLGWSILAGFTFGIGLIWLNPYIETTKANYFVQLLREKGLMEKPVQERDDDAKVIAEIEESLDEENE